MRFATGAALVLVVAAGSASAGPHQPDVKLLVADATDAGAPRDNAGTDPTQSRNAARSRMRECGHQWSAMKKNGAAAGTTWKEFSQGCLAKQ